MTDRERADTSTRQSDLFAVLVAEVVIWDGPANRLVVAKLEREPDGVLWVTRLLGKRSLTTTFQRASDELERIALAYNAEVVWKGTYSEKEEIRGST